MFTKGMRVEHKDVSRSNRPYANLSGKRGNVVEFPVFSEYAGHIEWVRVYFDEPTTYGKGKSSNRWLVLPEDIIPIDEGVIHD